MLKLIIFDWDDTIILGAKEGYYDCYRQALKAVGVKLDEKTLDERIRAKWGKKYSLEIKELLKEHLNKVDWAVKEFEKLSFSPVFFNHLKLLPGTVDLLKNWKTKYTLAIITGSEPKRLAKVQEQLKVPDVFSHILSSHQIDDSQKTKPHPYMVELVLKRLGIFREEAILVGDGKPDMQMARAAGVKTVAVLTGNLSRNQAEKLKADYIIADITQLDSVLDELTA